MGSVLNLLHCLQNFHWISSISVDFGSILMEYSLVPWSNHEARAEKSTITFHVAFNAS